MPQIFPKGANLLARATLFAGFLVVAGGAWAAGEVYRSSWVTGQDAEVEQPVPFSHQHHVQGLGLDCRYCHQGVEKAAMAGMPPTETCMTCHSQLYTDAPMLAPVRQSLATGVPIAWQRVTKLPDYVYFNHAAHLNRGVSCEACHGQVDQMPLTRKAHALTMQFCLDCHQHPPAGAGPVDARRLSSCSTCHR